jgi:nucleoside-diphosphate-sugar epimerase
MHIRAMIAPEAAAQRFIAAGDFMWLEEIAATLRSKLGSRASKVPTRRLPDLVFRLLSLFIPVLRGLASSLGRKNSVSSEKARRVLGFSPRPATTTVVDCAESLLSENAA